MAATVNCLYTTVINTSGREATFSFLPPHGKRMAAGEILTVAGNLVDRLAVKTSKRQFQAMERALMAGALDIISTPSVFVSDGGDLDTPPTVPQGWAISGEDKVLGLVDACWEGP